MKKVLAALLTIGLLCVLAPGMAALPSLILEGYMHQTTTSEPYLVKDINRGTLGSDLVELIAVNDALFR